MKHTKLSSEFVKVPPLGYKHLKNQSHILPVFLFQLNTKLSTKTLVIFPVLDLL